MGYFWIGMLLTLGGIFAVMVLLVIGGFAVAFHSRVRKVRM